MAEIPAKNVWGMDDDVENILRKDSPILLQWNGELNRWDATGNSHKNREGDPIGYGATSLTALEQLGYEILRKRSKEE